MKLSLNLLCLYLASLKCSKIDLFDDLDKLMEEVDEEKVQSGVYVAPGNSPYSTSGSDPKTSGPHAKGLDLSFIEAKQGLSLKASGEEGKNSLASARRESLLYKEESEKEEAGKEEDVKVEAEKPEESSIEEEEEEADPAFDDVNVDFELAKYASLFIPDRLVEWRQLRALERSDEFEAELPGIKAYIALLQTDSFLKTSLESVQEKLQEHTLYVEAIQAMRKAQLNLYSYSMNRPGEHAPPGHYQLPKNEAEVRRLEALGKSYEEQAVEQVFEQNTMYQMQLMKYMYKCMIKLTRGMIDGEPGAVRSLTQFDNPAELESDFRIPVVESKDLIPLGVSDEALGVLVSDFEGLNPLAVSLTFDGSDDQDYTESTGHLNSHGPIMFALAGSKDALLYFRYNHVHLKVRGRQAVRRMIFNQFITAIVLKHHALIVDLSELTNLGLSLDEALHMYEHYRRLFSLIQPGHGYELHHIILCNQD